MKKIVWEHRAFLESFWGIALIVVVNKTVKGIWSECGHDGGSTKRWEMAAKCARKYCVVGEIKFFSK